MVGDPEKRGVDTTGTLPSAIIPDFVGVGDPEKRGSLISWYQRSYERQKWSFL